MRGNVNCTANDHGVWCKDKRIKRSLWGIGARMCLVFDGQVCPLQQKYQRPAIHPPPQRLL